MVRSAGTAGPKRPRAPSIHDSVSRLGSTGRSCPPAWRAAPPRSGSAGAGRVGTPKSLVLEPFLVLLFRLRGRRVRLCADLAPVPPERPAQRPGAPAATA